MLSVAEVSRLLMVDSMRVRLDQCKEVLLIAGELESMKVQMNVFYILAVYVRTDSVLRSVSSGPIWFMHRSGGPLTESPRSLSYQWTEGFGRSVQTETVDLSFVIGEK